MSGLSDETKAILESLKKFRESPKVFESSDVYLEQYAKEAAQKAAELGFNEETSNNKVFVLGKLTQSIGAFEYASDELKGDKDFIREAVKLHPFAIFYASQELKSNKEFISSLMAINPEVLRYADKSLREDVDLSKLS